MKKLILLLLLCLSTKLYAQMKYAIILDLNDTPQLHLFNYAEVARMYYACSDAWDEMQAEYDNFPAAQLASMCANAVFIEQLFYNELHLTANQLWITDTINQTKINWPLGALLYLLLNSTPIYTKM